MDFLDSVKELYDSMEQDTAPCLEYCKFAPNIDDTALEHDLNDFAEKEEPAEVICIAKAKSTAGLIASLFGNTANNFLFTEQTLYIGRHGFKFDEISSITYQEETTSSLFGKQKQKNYLVVDKKSGESEKFGGGIAAESLARLLDGIVKKNNENPPAEKPQKEFPRSKMIADTLRGSDFPGFKITPKLDERRINSLIIHCGMAELKSSFAASYEKKLYFTNDNLYVLNNGFDFSAGEVKQIPYCQLKRAAYAEDKKWDNAEERFITEKKISLLDKSEAVIFENADEIAQKEVADFFNTIISDATGVEIKTEVEGAEKKYPNVKIIVEECTKRNLCKKYYGWKTYADIDYNESKFEAVLRHRARVNNEKKVDSSGFAVGNVSPFNSIYFFNEAIYAASTVFDSKRITYDQIGSVVYSEKFEKDHVSRCVTIYDKRGEVFYDSYVEEKEIADFFSNTISKITGAKIRTEVIIDDTLSLLNKWNDIFTKNNIIVDPVITTKTIEFVSEEERSKRKETGKYGDTFYGGKPKEIEINQYTTDTAMLEVGINNAKNQKYPETEYYIKYYADKANKDSYLLFRYDVEGDSLSTKSFLKLEFKVNGEGLCKEEERSISSGKDFKRLRVLPDDIYTRLERFAKKPYILTPEEKVRRKKLEQDKAEKERLQQEKEMKEQKQQHDATINALKNF